MALPRETPRTAGGRGAPPDPARLDAERAAGPRRRHRRALECRRICEAGHKDPEPRRQGQCRRGLRRAVSRRPTAPRQWRWGRRHAGGRRRFGQRELEPAHPWRTRQTIGRSDPDPAPSPGPARQQPPFRSGLRRAPIPAATLSHRPSSCQAPERTVGRMVQDGLEWPQRASSTTWSPLEPGRGTVRRPGDAVMQRRLPPSVPVWLAGRGGWRGGAHEALERRDHRRCLLGGGIGGDDRELGAPIHGDENPVITAGCCRACAGGRARAWSAESPAR